MRKNILFSKLPDEKSVRRQAEDLPGTLGGKFLFDRTDDFGREAYLSPEKAIF